MNLFLGDPRNKSLKLKIVAYRFITVSSVFNKYDIGIMLPIHSQINKGT